MEKFTNLTAVVAPLDRANIDTDAIIPKQFLKSIKRTGFGKFLFDEWRYQDAGTLDSDCSQRPLNMAFSLNQPEYQGAEILLTRTNFGCGSSREHAVWAVREYGFRVVISSSFADIFYNNCVQNGVLAAIITDQDLDVLFDYVQSNPGTALTVDLPTQTIKADGLEAVSFDIPESNKERLLEGLDNIAITLKHTMDIKAYEKNRILTAPWLFEPIRVERRNK